MLNFRCFALRFFSLLLACVCAGSHCKAASAYDAAVERARAALQSNDAIQGLVEAQKAIQSNRSGFEGHYYAGLALFRQGQLDDAEAALSAALRVSPSDSKDEIQSFLVLIPKERIGRNFRDQAERAFKDGRLNRAAELYTEAAKSLAHGQDCAFAAASLWAQRLNQPAKAAALLQPIIKNPESADLV